MKYLLFIIAVGACCHLKASKQMNWLSFPEKQTIRDAFATWDKNFRKKIAPGVARSKREFDYLLLNCSEMKVLDVEDIEPHMENARFQRYLNIKTAEEAYPMGDRPRGEEDISSVKYHTETAAHISPIIVMRIRKDHNERLIKLDGVHRIMAAILRRSKVKIFYIDPDICQKKSQNIPINWQIAGFSFLNLSCSREAIGLM